MPQAPKIPGERVGAAESFGRRAIRCHAQSSGEPSCGTVGLGTARQTRAFVVLFPRSTYSRAALRMARFQFV